MSTARRGVTQELMGVKVRSGRVDHSPMYAATNLQVEEILETAHSTVASVNAPA